MHNTTQYQLGLYNEGENQQDCLHIVSQIFTKGQENFRYYYFITGTFPPKSSDTTWNQLFDMTHI